MSGRVAPPRWKPPVENRREARVGEVLGPLSEHWANVGRENGVAAEHGNSPRPGESQNPPHEPLDPSVERFGPDCGMSPSGLSEPGEAVEPPGYLKSPRHALGVKLAIQP